MKVRKIIVEVNKTLQVRQYEPVSVRLVAEADIGIDDDFDEVSKELYRGVSKQCKIFVQNELTKHLMEVEGNDAKRKK
jgi:hypothetical protein